MVRRSVVDDRNAFILSNELSEFRRQYIEVGGEWRSGERRFPVCAGVEEGVGGGRKGEEGEGTSTGKDLADELSADEADPDDGDVEHVVVEHVVVDIVVAILFLTYRTKRDQTECTSLSLSTANAFQTLICRCSSSLFPPSSLVSRCHLCGTRSFSLVSPPARFVDNSSCSSACSLCVAAETVKVPQMAESISEGTLKTWNKQVGDTVAADEEIATIETDKVHPFYFGPPSFVTASMASRSMSP